MRNQAFFQSESALRLGVGTAIIPAVLLVLPDLIFNRKHTAEAGVTVQ